MTKTETFIAKAQAVHGKKYDYSLCMYDGARNAVEIICPIHKSFWQAPNNHIQGHGCCYCHNHSDHVYRFLQKLNSERGWNLIGGNQEFAIPSGMTAAGKYRFDGCDIQRLIFFEYNEKLHLTEPRKSRDIAKRQRLKEWLKHRGNEGKGTYIIYNAADDILTSEVI